MSLLLLQAVTLPQIFLILITLMFWEVLVIIFGIMYLSVYFMYFNVFFSLLNGLISNNLRNTIHLYSQHWVLESEWFPKLVLARGGQASIALVTFSNTVYTQSKPFYLLSIVTKFMLVSSCLRKLKWKLKVQIYSMYLGLIGLNFFFFCNIWTIVRDFILSFTV